MSTQSLKWWYSPLFISWKGFSNKLFLPDPTYLLPPRKHTPSPPYLPSLVIFLHLLSISIILLDITLTNLYSPSSFPFLTSPISFSPYSFHHFYIFILMTLIYGIYLSLPYLWWYKHLHRYRSMHPKIKQYYITFLQVWFVRTIGCVLVFGISPTLMLYGETHTHPSSLSF